ncbi:50S ribosomal protein L30P [Aeropyrum pernix K1]|uniref:Large ribosomal subunit protein uL30 n=1 Tax=Aeropyrum pernix (strain ATCC 700893 / DSM 11879 / JCM 9820 / NBRC 100138 / K1) TaxID=272557 RepID=RL30_AERPE|nr:50S ribosomal protein L30 [Aeropyrum pernix]Q9YF96.2 RecName: Full=Large ribosomal subunit protein uL30; AltName: Full=50S ribosomal protein L30 [Aeropyrum pernix K1]BAA79300.2 50S ribosomal protein L30P [Aeropyrum pernix K1]
MPLYAVIRIRGTVDVPPDIDKTLYLLRLRRRYTASIYHDSLPGLRDMLRTVEAWTTYGEIEERVLEELLRKRGRIVGDKPLTDKWVEENLGLSGLGELAEKLVSGELHYHRLEEKGVKPFFRLHPPRGGFKKSIKRMFRDGGELGYRGSAINELILKML